MWRVSWKLANNAPVMATAGNLLLQGGPNEGAFRAFNARTGRIVWSFRTGSNFRSSPISDRYTDSTLSDLLQDHRYNPEYSGPPFAEAFESSNGPSLITGYMLVRGGGAVNDSAVSIPGYRSENGRFRLVDSTGEDFNGYGLFIKKVPSPMGQRWVLAWGSLSTERNSRPYGSR